MSSTPASVAAAERKVLNPKRQPRHPLDRSVVLSDDVVEILYPSDFDVSLVLRVIAFDRRVLAPLLSIVIFFGAPF
jgi:hypothetical protein